MPAPACLLRCAAVVALGACSAPGPSVQAPPASAAPAPASTAPATPAPPLASSAAQRPRPALTSPRAREIEAILGDVCALQYTRQSDGTHTPGCRGCDFEARPSQEHTVEEEGASPGWGVSDLLRGSFSEAGADEVFLGLAGSCNPKHTGWALLRKREGRWGEVASSPASDTGKCHALRRADGRDMLACFGTVFSVFGTRELGSLLQFGEGQGQKQLFSLGHWRPESLPPGPVVMADVSIDGAEVTDVNRDGRPDVVVHFGVRRAAPRELAQALARPPAKRESLVFLHKGTSLALDARSEALLRSWTRELPSVD